MSIKLNLLIFFSSTGEEEELACLLALGTSLSWQSRRLFFFFAVLLICLCATLPTTILPHNKTLLPPRLSFHLALVTCTSADQYDTDGFEV
mmetsp:Transcript_37212/g.57929  ORF Transcript_37212/g.57929 Transcript_37212/m.57929 type:complete len:91 (+) Transcript_37212:1429-1701(+)